MTKKALRSGKVETYTYNGENQLIQSADNEGNQTTTHMTHLAIA
nr:hypothetical protein [Listeria marthii]